jgi:hypothetical protein
MEKKNGYLFSFNSSIVIQNDISGKNMVFKKKLKRDSSLEFVGIIVHNAQVHFGTNRMKVTSLIYLFHKI